MNVAVPWAESSPLSSAAVTVTVCVPLQLPVVNSSVLLFTVRSVSPPDALAIVTVTVPAGCAASFTVYVSVPPSGTVKLDTDRVTP